MKQTLFIILIISLSFLVISCDNKAPTWQDELIEEGNILIGISPDYPPFEDLDEDSNIIGFEPDLMAEIVKSLDGYKVTYKIMFIEDIVKGVSEGALDMGMSMFTYKEDRDVIYSDSYYGSNQVVLVRNDSNINSINDLVNIKVGAQSGATGLDIIKKYGDVKILEFPNAEDGMNKVLDGSIDAFILDEIIAKSFVLNNDCRIVEESLSDGNVSIIFNNNCELLRDKINDILLSFRSSDAYEDLKNKWGLKGCNLWLFFIYKSVIFGV